MLPAVVLAGGDSTRMGEPKALLRAPDGRAFIVRIVSELLAAGMAPVVVVTGRDHDRIAGLVGRTFADSPVRVVRNPDPGRGQLSSLHLGMDAAISSTTQAFVATLVDVPMIDARLTRRLVERWSATRAPAVRPAVGARHGHPVVFDRSLFSELRSAPADRGAKAVIESHAHEVVDVEVADEGCLRDVDTPDDYERLAASHRSRTAQ